MKIIFTIIISFFIASTYAMNPADFLNKKDENFLSECYKYYNNIEKSEIWSENEKYKTYNINIDKNKDLVFLQNGFILPYKYFSSGINNYNYQDNIGLDEKYLSDFNSNTYLEINSKTDNEIILSFNEILEKDNFSFIFNYYSKNFYPEYYISNDKNSWDLIKKSDIENFSFKYLKINFVSKTKEIYLENIKIYELSFPKKSNSILLKSFFNSDIEIYSSFECIEKIFYTNFLNYDEFSIDKDTKTINIKSELNKNFNTFSKKDFDNDGVSDEEDNCLKIYNPKQKDLNGDGVGDLCSDNDKDGIIGEKDNCIYVYNPDQKDINLNGVGDKCEFDKDKDGIFDKLDNCINTANPEQKDDDKDGIGNICDNCKLYNPSQLDKNENGIGDTCEKQDEYLKENDKDGDLIIDYKDNCKEVSNPNQEDYDKDGIGDICDNCLNIQNKDQLDFNKNGIGDICEDSDNDGIEGINDNCINIYNPEQKDSDNDGIGNACEDNDRDNIIYINDNCLNDYNPEQKDTDGDGLGDKCDEKDDRYIESNREFLIFIIVIVVLLFLIGIHQMIKSLNTKK